MRLQTASVDTVILYFEPRICEAVLNQVQDAYASLRTLEGIIALTPSYHSILIHYDLQRYDETGIRQAVLKRLENRQSAICLPAADRLVEIVVDYSQGVDLARVAQLHHLSVQEVIARHTRPIYRVYAIGFMVGFAYLGKVDEKIATPRLDTPRREVSAGSVAIAESQTAIYPAQSAGGWNLIGHTDFDGFDQFEVGDRVRFRPLCHAGKPAC
jgi:KipI family sensor histidine kinase inhibitor